MTVHPLGLRLVPPAHEGVEAYEAYVHFDEAHQSAPGIAHEGVVAAALEEACALHATWYRPPAVVARIFVRYRKPIPVETELLLRSEVESTSGRRIRLRAALLSGDDVLAEARAAFLHVPLEHLAPNEGLPAAPPGR